MNKCAGILITTLVIALPTTAFSQIPKPDDAPKPLSPAESAKQFRLPPGFRMKLLAAEPLITEPSGVCWDERGRLFVCELHGYNLEGQYDIEELNKTGQLDLVVRRIQADEKAKQKAKADTYGTVKLLLDRDGDGCMDDAIVWADRLPPCYGLVPARGGIIVACATDILFFKDADGDGKPDVRETLFTGFDLVLLERAMNCPQWGLDNWIYCGAGPGGTIAGPRLKTPVKLGRTDFRFRPDGSALEPVEGSTKTIGLTFTEGGDWFVATTSYPGHFVTPLPWRYLGRNPDAGTPAMDAPASDYQNVFPIAPPHPWRKKRAEDPAYSKYYRDRYRILANAAVVRVSVAGGNTASKTEPGNTHTAITASSGGTVGTYTDAVRVNNNNNANFTLYLDGTQIASAGSFGGLFPAEGNDAEIGSVTFGQSGSPPALGDTYDDITVSAGGGDITLTSTPTIADGVNGQALRIVNVGTSSITLKDQGTLAGSNLRLTASTITLGPRDSIELMFSSDVGDWVQVGEVVNVL